MAGMKHDPKNPARPKVQPAPLRPEKPRRRAHISERREEERRAGHMAGVRYRRTVRLHTGDEARAGRLLIRDKTTRAELREIMRRGRLLLAASGPGGGTNEERASQRRERRLRAALAQEARRAGLFTLAASDFAGGPGF